MNAKTGITTNATIIVKTNATTGKMTDKMTDGKATPIRTLVMVPAYNEQESLLHTIQNLESVLQEAQFTFDYVIINDGSKDDTGKICEEYNLNTLTHVVNSGLTCAIQTGLKYAYAHKYDFAVQFDSDGQHDAHYLDDMVKAAVEQEADIVIGSRFVGAKKNFSMRMIGSRLLSGIIKLTAHASIGDPTSGYRMYSKRMINRFYNDSQFTPEPDTLAYAIRTGAKVIEVPVVMQERFGGESYLTAWKSVSYMARMTMSILLFQWVRK